MCAQARKGLIRIMVDGIEGVGEIGPIPVSASDTIQEVEQKVQQWIRDNVGEFDAPPGGLLKLAFQGRELVSGASLLDQEVPDGATLQVPQDVEDVQAEGEADEDAE